MDELDWIGIAGINSRRDVETARAEVKGNDVTIAALARVQGLQLDCDSLTDRCVDTQHPAVLSK